MEHTERTAPKRSLLIAYFVVFYAIWALFELSGRKVVDSLVTDRVAAQMIKTVLVKNLLWTVPAAVLVSRCGKSALVGLKEMFTAKVEWLKVLPVFLLFTFSIFVNKLVNGGIALNKGFGVCSAIGLLFVGLTEEMVFRGWLLNVTADEEKPLPALLINAVMFMTIHFPVWIVQDQFVSTFTSGGFITLMLLSVIFGQSFLKTRSILVPIVLHMYWDLLMFVLA